MLVRVPDGVGYLGVLSPMSHGTKKIVRLYRCVFLLEPNKLLVSCWFPFETKQNWSWVHSRTHTHTPICATSKKKQIVCTVGWGRSWMGNPSFTNWGDTPDLPYSAAFNTEFSMFFVGSAFGVEKSQQSRLAHQGWGLQGRPT